MVAAELRGGNKSSLNEALGWIGSRVDDLYGVSVGRLEDVWIDPGTGVPRWLLVNEGRFGGRTTLIPFEDATAGAGHVWVPYEREIVRDAPEIEAGAPLTQQVETALRNHYVANLPAAMAQRAATPLGEAPGGSVPGSTMGTATIRFAGSPEAWLPEAFAAPPAATQPQPPTDRQPQIPPRRHPLREPPPTPAPGQGSYDYREGGNNNPGAAQLPERPAPPVAAPQPQPDAAYPPPQGSVYQPPRPPQAAPQPRRATYPQTQSPPFAPAPAESLGQPGYQRSQLPPQPARYSQPQAHQPPAMPPLPQTPPASAVAFDPAQGPIDALRALAETGGTHYVEIALSGELTIRGELRSIRVTPTAGEPPQR